MLDLTDRKTVSSLLKHYGIRLKKSLGQHFLVDKQVLAAVVEAGMITKGDTVLEIGAGIGVLTQELCQRAGKVVSFEKDEQLAKIFKETVVLKCDNLDLKVEDFLGAYLDFQERFKVISNLPYQITSPVIRKLLGGKNLPERIVLLIQKEVAERLAAPPGDRKRGWLSVLVQLYGCPRIARVVSKESFLPPPEVESAILVIDNIKRPVGLDEKRLFEVVKAGFSAKRRQLPNALAGGLGIELGAARGIVEKAGIDVKKRAEAITIEEWKRLASIVEN